MLWNCEVKMIDQEVMVIRTECRFVWMGTQRIIWMICYL
jgi:hypothetical protein